MTNDERNARDWLLARHASVAPQLDAARTAALTSLVRPPDASVSPGAFLRALFYPNRYAWGALAAVWVAIVSLHFTLARPAQNQPAAKLPASAVAAWVAQIKSHDTLAQLDHLD